MWMENTIGRITKTERRTTLKRAWRRAGKGRKRGVGRGCKKDR